MNIFVLDEDPIKCAQMHCDIHVLKMTVESAQMLCTAIFRFSRGEVQPPYKPTHRRHPCTLWAMESIENFMWLADLGMQLCLEYEHRFKKIHKTKKVIQWCLENCPRFPHVAPTAHPLVMDDCFKVARPTLSYQAYYRHKAQSMKMRYTNRSEPTWLQESI